MKKKQEERVLYIIDTPEWRGKNPEMVAMFEKQKRERENAGKLYTIVDEKKFRGSVKVNHDDIDGKKFTQTPDGNLMPNMSKIFCKDSIPKKIENNLYQPNEKVDKQENNLKQQVENITQELQKKDAVISKMQETIYNNSLAYNGNKFAKEISFLGKRNHTTGKQKNERPNPILVADEFAYVIPYRLMGGIAYIPKVLERSSNFKVFVPMEKRDVQGQINFMYHTDLIDYSTTRFIDEVYNCLMLRLDRDVFEPDIGYMKHRIFFRNGCIDLRSGEFTNTNVPDVFFNSYLDINYNPVAVSTPYFDEFLRQISGGDTAWQQYLLEILGCCISNDFTSIKGLFVFQGRGNTGKTKLLSLLQKLYPPVLRGNLKLKEFGERFGPGMLAGKSINIGDENTGTVNNDAVNMLKAFTSAGGTEISVERKYKDKINIPARCHMIFATNEYLRFEDATDAFLRRVYVLPFVNTFNIDTSNMTLDEVLLIERVGIVQKLIAAYRLLMARNYQFSAFYPLNAVVDSVSEQFDEDYRKKNLFEWCCQRLEKSYGDYVGIVDLLGCYNLDTTEQCLPNFVYPSVVQFAKDLREINLPDAVFENKVVKKGKGQRSALINYRLK